MIFEHLLVMIRWMLATPLLLLRYIREWIHFRRLASRFPGPTSYPLVGNLFNFGFPLTATRVISTLVDLMKQHSAGQISLGPTRVFFLSDPHDVQCYLLNPENQSKPPMGYEMISQTIGLGLNTSSGSTWKRHNEILLPTFHTDILNDQVAIFSKKSDVFIEVLKDHADGHPYDMKYVVECLILDNTFESLCDISTDYLRKPDHEFLKAVIRAQELVAYRISHPWLVSDIIFYHLTSFGKELTKCKKIYFDVCEKVLRDREKLLDEQVEIKEDCEELRVKKKRHGFLETMIHHMRNEELTRDEVLDEIVSFMAAGFDTTYSSVLLCIHLISKHLHVQEKLYSEIRDIFKENGSTDITLDMLQQMPYLEMVLKECLRLYPTLWVFLRMTGVDTPLATSDLVVPAGAVVAVSPKSMHMNPKLFPDPEVFDPERFSPENSKERHPYAFLTFSMGKRACLGRRFAWMQMKTIICKVLWNYEVLPDPTYTPILDWGVCVLPTNGMRVKLMKRKN